MDDDTRTLLVDVVEVLAATLATLQIAAGGGPPVEVERHLRAATRMMLSVRERLRTPDEQTTHAIRDAILREYLEAGAPYGRTRKGLVRWLGEGAAVEHRAGAAR